LRISLVSKLAPLAATLVVMAVSAFANTATINGLRTGQISDRLPTGFTPAGWVFSIWSVIYLALLVFSVAGLAGSEALQARVARVRSAYLVSAGANVGWIFAWHHFYVGVSLALMLLLLGSLVAITRELRRTPAPSTRDRLATDVPFRIYLGWITTASIANLGALLSKTAVYPLGMTMEAWALASVVGAALVYVVVGLATGDAIFCAVYVWAAFGIWAKPAGIPTSVRHAALVGGGVVFLVASALAARGVVLWRRARA